jgi:hypothetical protein
VPRKGSEAGDHHKIIISGIVERSLQKTLFGIQQQTMSLRIKKIYRIKKISKLIRVIHVINTAAAV